MRVGCHTTREPGVAYDQADTGVHRRPDECIEDVPSRLPAPACASDSSRGARPRASLHPFTRVRLSLIFLTCVLRLGLAAASLPLPQTLDGLLLGQRHLVD